MIELGKPESIEIIEFGNIKKFVWKHFSPIAYFSLFFCIAWDSFLVFWYFGDQASELDLLGKIFPIAHVAVGIGLTYYVITLFINKTEISIQNGRLIVRDTPLPRGNSKNLNSDDFAQFYVKEKISRGGDSNSVSYVLMGITKQGNLKKIISGLYEKEEGLYLEQEIENILKIDPEPVKGEVK